MQSTTVSLHTDFLIGPVDERVFGGFLEHLGRAVYEGVYEPKSPHADRDGFRGDVCAALARLRMTAMRWPGGNFASGYHWMDGVGPRDHRPTVRDLAWQSLEPNHFGTDEFIRLCGKMSWTPMVTVNLGTAPPEEARNWVEYCNCPAGTRYADLRAENGSADPFGVKLWCLGNEMDGPWQLGHVPAEQYAIRAQQAAKMMKDADPSLELIVCGSCGVGLPTYMEWDRTVLDYCWDQVHYLSIHRYVGNPQNDTPTFLATGREISRQIENAASVCRFVQARKHSSKPVRLCFDEWNVWYKSQENDGRGKFAPHLLEEFYNLEDALVVGEFLHTFLQHADVLKIANIAQIVNVIAPIRTRGDEMMRQTIFHTFEMFSTRREGTALRTVVSGPTYEAGPHGPVPFVNASAIAHDERLHVFLTNRSLEKPADVEIALTGRSIARLESGQLLSGDDPKAANSFEVPDAVVARPFEEASVSHGNARVQLPPLSLAALTFELD